MTSPQDRRTGCSSLEVIKEKHGCVDSDLRPYTAFVLPTLTGPVRQILATALESYHRGYDLTEIYVHPHADERGFFEPLAARHFALDGEVVVVAKRRHPTDAPRLVGIMLAKDEADVIPEVCSALRRHLDILYYHAPDAPTQAALAQLGPWAREVNVSPRDQSSCDGLRHFLLEQARADQLSDHDPRPMWVVSAQGDEIYHDDLRHHVDLAHQERSTALTCQVATFLLHDGQREGWDWAQPLEKRLTHYIWDFGEHVGFRDFPWIYYDAGEHMRAHPHGIYPALWASARPVRKHYPFRSPAQAEARIRDRLQSGWQPHYKHYQQLFFKEGEMAAGREVKRYHGWFGEAERTPGIW